MLRGAEQAYVIDAFPASVPQARSVTMQIGVMLRGVDKKGGTGVYARNLVPELLDQGRDHRWTLLYSSPAQLGSFGAAANVREVVLRSRSALWWDQVLVPRYTRTTRLNVLFHTKFTVPLLGGTPAVMALHGASWYTEPSLYKWWDVRYIRLVMPLYCRKAAHLVSNSQCTTNDYVNLVGSNPENITTVPLAASELFRPISDDQQIERVRHRYKLPAEFLLSVVAYDPRKNVPRLLEAFAKCRRRRPCKLVLVGKDCTRYREELPELMSEVGKDVITPGWVEQSDLPALYSMATVFFFPSIYEEFGIPNCEAMACGTPIVSASTGAVPEVVGNAALTVDPHDTDAMADALVRLLNDADLRRQLSERGLERSKMFSWKRTARETLRVLEGVGHADADPDVGTASS